LLFFYIVQREDAHR